MKNAHSTQRYTARYVLDPEVLENYCQSASGIVPTEATKTCHRLTCGSQGKKIYCNAFKVQTSWGLMGISFCNPLV